MSKLIPRGEFVIVQPHETEKEINGITVSTTTSIKTQGTIVGVSKEVSDLQDGQVIIYIPNRNVEVNQEGSKYLFVHQEDILAIINEH